MKRFVEGVARDQGGLFPAHLEDFVDEDNPVRAVDAFVEKLDYETTALAPCPIRCLAKARRADLLVSSSVLSQNS